MACTSAISHISSQLLIVKTNTASSCIQSMHGNFYKSNTTPHMLNIGAKLHVVLNEPKHTRCYQ